MLDGHDAVLEVLILLLDRSFLAFELFHFLTLAFPAGLCRCSISEHPLYSSLLFFVLSLCSFPAKSSAFNAEQVKMQRAYRGGRLVLGVGSS